MPRPGFVDRHDLKGWADTVSARSDLPRLVRKLVLETTPTAEHIAFAAVEGVATGGFDGTVRALESTPWVPAGLSLWELSVDSSPGRKADKDYEKRISTPDGSSTTDAVYVQLSLRPWTKRAEWAKQKRQDGRWHDVIAYGLDDVHAWLEAAPVTWAWLSEEMGRHPRGLRSAETWWSAWSSQTSPAATTDLVLAGRASARDELLASSVYRTSVLNAQECCDDGIDIALASYRRSVSFSLTSTWSWRNALTNPSTYCLS